MANSDRSSRSVKEVWAPVTVVNNIHYIPQHFKISPFADSNINSVRYGNVFQNIWGYSGWIKSWFQDKLRVQIIRNVFARGVNDSTLLKLFKRMSSGK